jgi:hypothetical protein
MNGEHKIGQRHRGRLALVYLRQSTAAQVREHTESTMRQYALADAAASLGWDRSQVLVLDGDLGLSGRSMRLRSDFKEVVSKVCQGEAGLVLVLEASRLSRNSADFQRLLEFCQVTDTLIADADGIYDLRDFNDQLLLGFKGTMSAVLCRLRYKHSYADLVVMPMSDAPSAIRAGQRDPRFREVSIIRVIHSGTSCFRRRSAGDRPCLGRVASNP